MLYFNNSVDKNSKNNLLQINPESNHQEMMTKILAQNEQIVELQSKNKLLKRKIKTIQQSERRFNHRMTNPSIETIFNEDQLHFLKNGFINGMEWSPDTIIKSLKTKFACGSKRYQYLRKNGYPFPSTTTLQRRMLGLQFDAGINQQSFDFLRRKI